MACFKELRYNKSMNINLFNKISNEVFGGSRYDDVVEKYGLRVIEKYMEFGEEGDLFIDGIGRVYKELELIDIV